MMKLSYYNEDEMISVIINRLYSLNKNKLTSVKWKWPPVNMKNGERKTIQHNHAIHIYIFVFVFILMKRRRQQVYTIQIKNSIASILHLPIASGLFNDFLMMMIIIISKDIQRCHERHSFQSKIDSLVWFMSCFFSLYQTQWTLLLFPPIDKFIH